jgi:hypothetical protein
MKITRRQLKQIINEHMQINEGYTWGCMPGRSYLPGYYSDFANLNGDYMNYEEQIEDCPKYADEYSKEMYEISEYYVWDMDDLTDGGDRDWDYDEPKIAKLYKETEASYKAAEKRHKQRLRVKKKMGGKSIDITLKPPWKKKSKLQKVVDKAMDKPIEEIK